MSLVITRHGGKLHVHFTGAESVEEAREQLEEAGSDEKVVSLIPIRGDSEAATMFTTSIGMMDDEPRDTFERLFTAIARCVEQHCNKG